MSDAAPETVAPDQAGAAAPTATPAPGASAAPDAQPAEGGDTKPDAAPERTFTQSELDRIVDRARRKESRRAEAMAYERARREAAEERLRELEQGGPDRGRPDARAPGEEPRQEDFKDWDSYNRAVIRWELEQTRRQEAESAQHRRSSQEQAEYARSVQEAMAGGVEKYDDFEARIGARGVVFTPTMVDALLITDAPADVAYNLAASPAETQRIASLPRAKQVLAVKEFAESLTKPPAPTKAPEPITPNKSDGGSAKTIESVADNYDEWLKLRNRQLGRA